jgi:negative regulator of genetic competence, sporulation and motility
MIIETLNENVMLLELSGDEMEKFHITYDILNCNNEKTKNVLKTLLHNVDSENRLSKGEKVLIEAMPIENGGCFFILTFSQKRKTVYKIKRNNESSVFQTDNIDNMLDFLSAIRKSGMKEQNLEAFTMNNEYFIFIPEMGRKLNIIMNEYGNNARNISYERLREYGTFLGNIYLQ